jgi:twinkle protein
MLMSSLPDNLREELCRDHGIKPASYQAGNHKMACPRCSAQRTKKTDPCLSLTIEADGATWLCHHCGWSGGVRERNASSSELRKERRERRAAPAKPKNQPGPLTPAALAYLADRGISEAVARRNGVGVARVWMPGLKTEVDALAFPYRRNGEVVNFKFRSFPEKHFAQVKDAEKIFFGLDDIGDSKTAIIVEGEPDKLALEEAGFRNGLSVPDGAPAKLKAEPDPSDPKFEYLANCADELSRIEKFILAGDDDEPGRVLREELARRLGKERCWTVKWPDAGDAPMKDANQVLQVHGVQVLAECITNATPYPIAGLHNANDFAADTISLYREGRKRGLSTGWSSIDELLTVRPGEMTVVTGIPNSGKSEFVDAVMVNLATRYGWRFAVCSFENPPAEHMAKLVEKHLGMPFWDGPSSRMSEDDLRRALDWVDDHFYLIRADDEAPTIDWILTAAKGAVLRHGIRGLVIDPYNEIEHKRPANQTETEYVSQLLGKVKRFAQIHGVHVWFVAHPAKMQRDGNNSIPAPTLYDISGSANWANKADIGLVVHRDPNKDPLRTDIYVRKVRFKSVGKIGVAGLRYERSTGRYFEIERAAAADAARRYPDD